MAGDEEGLAQGGETLVVGQGEVADANGALFISGGTARVEAAARMTARTLPGWLVATMRARKFR
ncbi:hypothetical protein [Streptomyces sp. 6N106]|uniref:hypothetical protein n=1 Tax=Streptomyces sp. 6N106 TaxID=3457418 RepID=UPI003FD4E38D